MLDGTLFFVKSARYGKPGKDFVRLFYFYSCTLYNQLTTLKKQPSGCL